MTQPDPVPRPGTRPRRTRTCAPTIPTAAALCLALASHTAPLYADSFADQAPERLTEYIRVDTTNPPGNEIAGARFFAKYLDAAGIEYEIGESATGRGNLWARIEGGRKPGVVLLNHMDVVPADERYWTVPAFDGVEKDGDIYGRGAIDMKGLGIVQFQAFLSLAASGRKPNRDVWFIATADEEAGGSYGAGWLAKEHPEIFRKVGFLLNEGGSGAQLGDAVRFNVEVTQKVPVWLRLIARGRPGHGSSPQVNTAVTRLLAAGHRIASTNFPARAIPPVAAMFAGSADAVPEPMRARYADIAAHVGDAEFMLALQLTNPGHHALLRDTCSATVLEGSNKINVVPPQATLELDCRLLPDQDVDRFIAMLTTIIADPDIEIERIMAFTPAISRTDTELYRAIEQVTQRHYPGSRVIPSVSTGFTDSHFFRDLGIVAYGFGPFVSAPENFRGVHGNDEKISQRNVVEGTTMMRELLDAMVLD